MADSLNGLLDLGQRLHSMPAVLDVSSTIRCRSLRCAILRGCNDAAGHAVHV